MAAEKEKDTGKESENPEGKKLTELKPGADELAPIKNVEACIEAIVFAAGYPVPYQKLCDVIGLGLREIKQLVARIAKHYENEDRGFLLLRLPDACQFCTKDQYGAYIRAALGIRRGGNLSSSSMEVLAIVAYNQPVTRAFIDAVRGVDSNYAVSSLIDKELIGPKGRLDAPGRPMLYGTTDKFLRVFGLSSLSELPKTEIRLPESKDGEQLAIALADAGAADETANSDETGWEAAKAEPAKES